MSLWPSRCCPEFMLHYRPQLVIVTSRFASRYADEIVRDYGIPVLSAPHPAGHWWNTKARSYCNLAGRDLFSRFLMEQHWLARTAN